MKLCLAVILACSMLIPAAVCPGAATWYVATNGTDGATPPWGESWDYPFATLSNAAAQANAAAGSVVLLSNGVYNITNEIVLTNGAICRGWSGDPRDVVVDGCSTSRGFFIKDSAVAALSVTNCKPSNRYGDGGGIYSVGSSMISNCVIDGNSGRYGGGVRVDATGVVADCRIVGNYATQRAGGAYVTAAQVLRCTVQGNYLAAGGDGGGVYLSGTSVLDGCDIAKNAVTNGDGGGIYDGSVSVIAGCQIVSNTVAGTNDNKQGGGCFVKSASVYSNCVIAHNRLDLNVGTSYGGGGICVGSLAAPLFYNCLVYSNQAKYGAGAFLNLRTQAAWLNCTIAGNTASNNGGGLFFRTGTDTVANCVVYDNLALVGVSSNYHISSGAVPVFSNCCVAPAPAGTNDGGGNTIASPLFINPAAVRFQLQPGSPCINAGTNAPWMDGARDLDGRQRLDRFSGIVDIGCYEHVARGALFTLH